MLCLSISSSIQLPRLAFVLLLQCSLSCILVSHRESASSSPPSLCCAWVTSELTLPASTKPGNRCDLVLFCTAMARGLEGANAVLLLVLPVLFVSVFSRVAPTAVPLRSWIMLGCRGLEGSLETARFRTNCTSLPRTANSNFSLIEYTTPFSVVSIRYRFANSTPSNARSMEMMMTLIASS